MTQDPSSPNASSPCGNPGTIRWAAPERFPELPELSSYKSSTESYSLGRQPSPTNQSEYLSVLNDQSPRDSSPGPSPTRGCGSRRQPSPINQSEYLSALGTLSKKSTLGSGGTLERNTPGSSGSTRGSDSLERPSSQQSGSLEFRLKYPTEESDIYSLAMVMFEVCPFLF